MTAVDERAEEPGSVPLQHLLLGTLLALSLLWLWSSGYKDVVTWSSFLYVMVRIARRREHFDLGGLGLPLLLYLLVTLVSCFNSVDRHFSFRTYYKLLELVAGMIALAHLLRPAGRSGAATRCVAAAMGLLWLADGLRLLAHQYGQVQIGADGRWYGSLFGFPTLAAGTYSCGFVLCVACLMQERRALPRLAWAAALSLCGLLLVHLQTRSILLGLGVALAFLLLAMPGRRAIRVATVGLGFAVLLTTATASPAFRSRLAAGTFSDRLGVWQDAVAIIRTAPLTGIGYGHGILVRVHKYMPRHLRHARHRYDHAHNMLLETALESGLPGLAAWLALLGTAGALTLRALRRAARPRRFALAASAAALLSLLCYGQFSAFFAQTPIFLFWNLLGLLVAAWGVRPATVPPPQ